MATRSPSTEQVLTAPTNSKRISMRGSIIGTTARRDMIEMQFALDREVFDPTLGCPLSSFEGATLGLIGGKALSLWRLSRHGFPVPTAFVIPTYVYSLHISEAGVAQLINDVYTADLNDEQVRDSMKPKLQTIREKIMVTPLNPEVITNLKLFLDSVDAGSFFAVRSSSSAEDLASQSFAGQYDTWLYKTSLDEIIESVKGCWMSMFKENITDYATHFEDYVPGKIAPPTMGVLIMKMIDSQASGVCFSRNFWGDDNEAMIEAVLGQGEGLVSGAITPDRYVVDKYSTRVCYSDVVTQTKMFVRASNKDGVKMISLDKPHEGPVLSEQALTKLSNLARSVEEYYNAPQDIEFALDRSGSLYILQSRPITTANKSSSLSFLPPGDGFWSFDPNHFPRPLSPWMQNYSLENMTHNSRRVGCLIKKINVRTIHGFAFTQPQMFPPTDIGKLEQAAKSYWEKKLYEEDYREFTDFFREDCAMLHQELRIVDPAALSHPSLVAYVAKCYDQALEFWKLHHNYTIPCMVVVGDYMNRMAELTGKGLMETLKLLEGASPESRGMLNKNDPELAKMYDLLKHNKKASELLECNEAMAPWALDCLLHMPGELGEILRKVSLEYGWRLAGGYDLCVPSMIESPHFFIKTLQQGVQEDNDLMKKNEDRVKALTSEWRESLPENKREKFDEILDVGRRFFRMRDERALSTDLSGVALCRRGILEAGRRLTQTGVINAPEHLTVATKNEAISLLTGDLRGLEFEKPGPIEVPTASVLERRFLHIKNADPQKVPRTLGTPPGPPPDIPLPPNIGRTMASIEASLLKGMRDESSGSNEDVKDNPNRVVGVSASMGKVTGPVTVVIQDSDLKNVKKGDIVVTYSASASFNIVLALCAGIVTDYGGMLSHAAIVAREYGIPAIVGSQDATLKFKTGDIVTIDTATHSVSRV